MKPELLEEKLTALSESEMEFFRFLADRPGGVILSADTDKILAELLETEGLAQRFPEDKVIIPADIREEYRNLWTDELTLKWRKRNWMYKCLEAGMYLYGVMTWDVLKSLFALRYPHAEMDEIKALFETTPDFYAWFTERDGKLVLNGYEKEDYYLFLEKEIQNDIPFYIPTREEVEDLYENGCLLSRESHVKLQDFIVETFGCDKDTACVKLHELYEGVNNRVRLNDAVDKFAAGMVKEGETYAFPSDESQVKFIELYMEMSRECRIRDNRGHDWYEMTAIMAGKNKASDSGAKKSAKNNAQVKRVKIGRNEPCPCGSGKKYKNCCGKN